MIAIDMQVKGLVELQAKLEKMERGIVGAVDRALAIVGQRGHDWLLEHAPVLSGDYRKSVSLEITPDGDVKVAVAVPYAKAVEAHQGTFNAMIAATMSSKLVMEEIDRQIRDV